MMIPDVRNDDYYNQDFLDGIDKEFLRGFDWAVEMGIYNFFDNIGDALFDKSDYLRNVFDKKVPEELQDEYIMHFAFSANVNDDKTSKDEVHKIETYGDLVKAMLLEYIETERDELVTSMIDNMDEKLYKAVRNRALKDNEKKENPKEYIDTRKYAVTGKKVFGKPEEEE